ncbi:MAG: hypothetical protein JWQ89_3687 [Devosia sp.]|uniref:hypothetical protein n=1 Tax=Devosia sp. TaxID=1871048 RepID=UPI00260EDBE2|nr:hypothetical protein [Devosia sp.]MDB5541960.1 hypothetical protein [Devosia sp.]
MSELALPPPYSADTRAKGWRFELDLERIKQSDTWALASADVRPWLLMLWSESWAQVPCGSLPADDELIAARIGMPLKAFAKVRAMLMRGWWSANDGRLYHDVIATRVLSMLDSKRKESDRKAEYRRRMETERASSPVVVPRDTLGTDEGHPRDSTGCDDTSTSTSTSTGTRRREEEKPARKRASPRIQIECPEGVSPQVWTDWLQLRKDKRAPVTETVLAEAVKQASIAGLSLENFLRVWCSRGSQGLEASWLKPSERGAAFAKPELAVTVPSAADLKTKELLRQQAEHAAEVERQRLARIAAKTKEAA